MKWEVLVKAQEAMEKRQDVSIAYQRQSRLLLEMFGALDQISIQVRRQSLLTEKILELWFSVDERAERVDRRAGEIHSLNMEAVRLSIESMKANAADRKRIEEIRQEFETKLSSVKSGADEE